MTKKQKECFTPHVMMHSLFGLGLGFIIASLIPDLPLFWAGIIACAVAFILDYRR